MTLNNQGHILISPPEFHKLAAASPSNLIERYLIPGTPKCFSSRDAYYDFLEYISHEMGIHPRNIILKGSTKIGFSVAPKAEKLWMSYGDGSDLDLAVVDSALYERLDNEVRHWERENTAIIMKAKVETKAMYARRDQRKNYCCRYFDMPAVTTRISMFNTFGRDEATFCSGIYRNVDAFVFRDWWALRARYDYDLQCLLDGVDRDKKALPPPPNTPIPYDPNV